MQIVFIGDSITEGLGVIRSKTNYATLLYWRRPGWMDPRPYYSTHMFRRVIEKVESVLAGASRLRSSKCLAASR